MKAKHISTYLLKSDVSNIQDRLNDFLTRNSEIDIINIQYSVINDFETNYNTYRKSYESISDIKHYALITYISKYILLNNLVICMIV